MTASRRDRRCWRQSAPARAASAARVVVAVPVAPKETCRTLSQHADEVVCLNTPGRFRAVGDWYDDFSQVDDEEVRRLLGLGSGAVRLNAAAAGPRAGPGRRAVPVGVNAPPYPFRMAPAAVSVPVPAMPVSAGVTAPLFMAVSAVAPVSAPLPAALSLGRGPHAVSAKAATEARIQGVRFIVYLPRGIAAKAGS